MTVHEWRLLKMAKLRDKIQEQEPVVDSLLLRLVKSPHTAEILCIVVAVVAAMGVLYWLLA